MLRGVACGKFRRMTDTHALKRSPLHERHVALGAKFAEFGGWEMPLEYSGVVAEHTAVRTAVGVFDVSHLGKATVRGAGAAAYVNVCLTNELGRIGPGQAQYTLCCADDGGVVDDLIAYLHDADDVFLIPNAANTTEVVRRLAAAAPDGVTVTNQHDEYAVLAVQGTRSDEVVSSIGLPAGEPYGIVPAGLGARDTLRTEMGYPLHGQDISPSITPVQARLGWAVGWKKESFWGHEALRAEKEAGPARLLRGLLAVGRGIPRPHMNVLNSANSGAESTVIGEVTSGTFSPTLKKGVALALVDASYGEGDEVVVDVRGRQERFQIVKPPFVSVHVRED